MPPKTNVNKQTRGAIVVQVRIMHLRCNRPVCPMHTAQN